MYGKRFQWINWIAEFGLGGTIDRDLGDGCTYEQLVTVSNGMMTTEIGLFNEDEFSSRPGAIGLVNHSYFFLYKIMCLDWYSKPVNVGFLLHFIYAIYSVV